MRVTEDAFAEKPAIEWLEAAGWSPRGSTTLILGGSDERKILGDVVLLQALRAAALRPNPELPAEAVIAAVERAMTGTSPVLILDHQDFHGTLLASVSVSWRTAVRVCRTAWSSA